MTHLDLPWIEDNDPLKTYYGQMHLSKIREIVGNFPNFYEKDKLMMHFSNYDYMLDFCIHQPFPYFDLLNCIFKLINHNDNRLFWFPWDYHNTEQIIFEYNPPMIVETNVNIDRLTDVSCSFMQMQNGSYALTDAYQNFYSVVLDGYYAIFLIKKDFINDTKSYKKNWDLAKSYLDKTTYLSLEHMFLCEKTSNH
ncbi:hypothetical protein [Moraxella marmotae]|uniref:hypothetical protein n=1 Tax=Moraxella marmotae TaxID=3344520 RepID=UPI0035F2D330